MVKNPPNGGELTNC